MPRPICATSSECVNRVRGVSLCRGPTTCVLSASRRNAAQCSTLARSRAKSVRCSVSVPGSAALFGASTTRRCRSKSSYGVLVRGHRRTVCQERSPVPGAGVGGRTTLTIMRIARLLSLVLAILTAGALLAPTAAAARRRSGCPATSPTRREALSGSARAARSNRPSTSSTPTAASGCGWSTSTRFASLGGVAWAERTRRINDFDADDAILAVATQDRAYAFLVPTDVVSDVGRPTTSAATTSNPAARQRLGRCRGRRRRRAATPPAHPARESRRWPWSSRWPSSSSWCCCCGCGAGGGGASAARPSSPPRAASTQPTPTRWPPSQSTRSTTCPSRSSSTSTTPSAPATTN